MAHTGSYATTTFDTRSVLTPFRPAISWSVVCSTCVPASRTSSFSPMHMIGAMSCFSAAFTLKLTNSSVSSWYSRRSEWPTHT
jgi:hypothetical protein